MVFLKREGACQAESTNSSALSVLKRYFEKVRVGAHCPNRKAVGSWMNEVILYIVKWANFAFGIEERELSARSMQLSDPWLSSRYNLSAVIVNCSCSMGPPAANSTVCRLWLVAGYSFPKREEVSTDDRIWIYNNQFMDKAAMSDLTPMTDVLWLFQRAKHWTPLRADWH